MDVVTPYTISPLAFRKENMMYIIISYWYHHHIEVVYTIFQIGVLQASIAVASKSKYAHQ